MEIFRPITLSLIGFLIASCGGNSADSDPNPDVINLPPTVMLKEEYEVARSGVLTISPEISDDGQILDVKWEQVDGTGFEIVVADNETLKVIAPEIEEQESVSWRITVTDNEGAETTTGTTVKITPNIFSDKVIDSEIEYFPDDSSYVGRFLVGNLGGSSNPEIVLTKNENGKQIIDIYSYEDGELNLSKTLDIGTEQLKAIGNILQNGREQLLLSQYAATPVTPIKIIDDVLGQSSDYAINLSNTGDFLESLMDFDSDGLDELVFGVNTDKDVIVCKINSSSADSLACDGQKVADVEQRVYGNPVDFSFREFVDLNGDGKLDILQRKINTSEQQTVAADNTSIKVSFQAEEFTFVEVSNISENEVTGLLSGWADINQDGLTDLIFQSTDKCYVFENNGSIDNNFSLSVPLDSFESCDLGGMASMDVDGDGINDLVSSDGRFYDVTQTSQGYTLNLKELSIEGQLFSIVDFDGDTDSDLISYVIDISTFFSGDVFVSINQQSSGFSDMLRFFLYKFDDHDYSFAGIDRQFHDIDQDGDLDLVIVRPSQNNSGGAILSVQKNLIIGG